MLKRRPIEVFSLSFLDCLCCGFGAILLLFILSIGSGKAGQQDAIEAPDLKALREQLAQLEADIGDKSAQLQAARNRAQSEQQRQQLQASVQQLSEQLAQLQQEVASRQANLSASQQEAAKAQRLLQSFKHENLPPIGLPSEATHVAFIIDSSGSMRNQISRQLHYAVIEQISELLDSLPAVDRIQFIDSSGNYMLGGRKNYWLPDSPGLRKQALRTVLNYPLLSVSDPEPGIRQAFRDLLPAIQAEQRMSLYVIGDDFRGSTQSLLLKLDRLNRRDPQSGERRVSISAVGFPTLVDPFRIGAPQGNARFANIMREIAEAHDGVLILKPRI